MSYQSLNQVDIADGAHLDAFGRLRISDLSIQFQSFSEYGIKSDEWVTSTSTGSVTHSTTTKQITLANGGTTNGNNAILQSKKYARYAPGQSLVTELTFVMGSAVSNVIKRVGLFDASNGMFFEQNGTGGVRVCRRSSTSGSVVNTYVEQADWNVDKLDGTGKSGITLDITMGQILFIDYQFLGVGRVRIGFVIDGIPHVCHEFLHANRTATQPYIATPNVPARAEISNSGTAGSSTSFAFICAMIGVEGNPTNNALIGSAYNTATIATSTTFKPIISIRPRLTVGSINNRGWVVPETIDALVSSSDHIFAIVLNATLTGASWVDTGNITQYDVSSTAVTGGTTLHSGFLSATKQSGGSLASDLAHFPLVTNYSAAASDIFTIMARTVTGTGTAVGAINFKEYY